MMYCNMYNFYICILCLKILLHVVCRLHSMHEIRHYVYNCTYLKAHTYDYTHLFQCTLRKLLLKTYISVIIHVRFLEHSKLMCLLGRNTKFLEYVSILLF